jgi:hypothetical protein
MAAPSPLSECPEMRGPLVTIGNAMAATRLCDPGKKCITRRLTLLFGHWGHTRQVQDVSCSFHASVSSFSRIPPVAVWRTVSGIVKVPKARALSKRPSRDLAATNPHKTYLTIT